MASCCHGLMGGLGFLDFLVLWCVAVCLVVLDGPGLLWILFLGVFG